MLVASYFFALLLLPMPAAWSGLGEFLKMGGYGQYVWPAYLLWLVVFLLNYCLAAKEPQCLVPPKEEKARVST